MTTSDNAYAAMGWLDLEGFNGERLILESRARHFGVDIDLAERLGHWSDWLLSPSTASELGGPRVSGIVAFGRSTLPHDGVEVVEETRYVESENLAFVIIPPTDERCRYVKFLAVEDARHRQGLMAALNRRLVFDRRRSSYS